MTAGAAPDRMTKRGHWLIAGALALTGCSIGQKYPYHLARPFVEQGRAMSIALAVVLALCSEADAFVAASLTMLPLLPRLVFLVVGPAVDVKLFAMQAGVFGRAFAIRFAPVTFLVATVAGTAVGLLVLGGDR